MLDRRLTIEHPTAIDNAAIGVECLTDFAYRCVENRPRIEGTPNR